MISIICPFCQDLIVGLNAGDLVNNLRIHFADECLMIDPEDAARV